MNAIDERAIGRVSNSRYYSAENVRTREQKSCPMLSVASSQTKTSFPPRWWADVMKDVRSPISVGPESVLMDIGFKSEGTIQLSEFPDPDNVNVDDTIDVLIEVVEDQDGMIVLSKTKADKIKNWAKIQSLYEDNQLVEGKIVRKVKGGFKVDIGLDAFLPASQIARRPVGLLK